MSTRSSQVYGEIGRYHWHGWVDVMDRDREWFYLDITTYGEAEMVMTLNDDEKTEAKVKEFFVKMPTRVFDRIAREYVAEKNAEAERAAKFEAERDAFEAVNESCFQCTDKYGNPGYTQRVRPTCDRCGGTGKPTVKAATEEEL